MKSRIRYLFIAAILLGLAAVFVIVPAHAATIPTITIVSVVPDVSVTIRTNNYPADQTFTVRMGAFGTQGINGTVVGELDSGSGGSLEATYNIPAGLKGMSKIAIRLQSAAGYYSYNWFYNSTSGAGGGATSTPSTPAPTLQPGYSGIPTISIVSVTRDVSVRIKTNNYPAGQTFVVTMGPFGTQGINGTVVGELNSGSGGSLEATYNIPSQVRGLSTIAIRLQSPADYYSYNWFYNLTGSGSTGPTPTVSPTPSATQSATPSATTTPAPTQTIPTISIVSVVRNTSVTIKTHNYPANQTFTARMGQFGTQAVNGIVVGTVNSGNGSSFDATFDIPSELKGLPTIAIRLDSPAGYYSYNWFYN
jgi:hypothetical protein